MTRISMSSRIIQANLTLVLDKQSSLNWPFQVSTNHISHLVTAGFSQRVLIPYLKSHLTSIQTSHLRLMIGVMGFLNRCDMPNWERILGRWLKPAVTRC
jgi:hypothetical protein